MSGLEKALGYVAQQIKDPFLLLILGLAIILAIIGGVQAGLYPSLIVAGAALVMFFAYLHHLRRTIDDRGTSVYKDLALRIIIAIKDEGYVPGNERQRDLGAALAASVMRATGDDGSREAAAAMAAEFVGAFDVPESMITWEMEI